MDNIELLKQKISELKLLRKRTEQLNLGDFQDMSALANEFTHADDRAKAIVLCEEALKENVVQLPLLFFFVLVDDAKNKQSINAFSKIIDEFKAKQKTSLIEYIFGQIEAISQSVEIYKIYLRYVKETGSSDDYIKFSKKILELDLEDFVTAEKLADHYSKIDPIESYKYLEICFDRAQKFGAHSYVIKLIRKLIQAKPERVDAHLTRLEQLNLQQSVDEQQDLLAFLLKNQEQNNENSMASIIKIIKTSLQRNIILETQLFLLFRAYKEVYKDNAMFAEISSFSGLSRNIKKKTENSSAKKLLTLLERFEKLMSYEKGVFVKHKAFGYGRIVSYIKTTPLGGGALGGGEKTKLKIDFVKKRNHEMSLDIAENSLNVLHKTNLHCIKFFAPADFEKMVSETSQRKTLLSALLRTLEKPSSQKDINDLLLELISKDKVNEIVESFKGIVAEGMEYELNDRLIWFSSGKISPIDRALKNWERTTNPLERIKIIDRFLQDQSTSAAKESLSHFFKKLSSALEKNEQDSLIYLTYFSYLFQKYNVSINEIEISNFSDSFQAVYNKKALLFACSAMNLPHLRTHLFKMLTTLLAPNEQKDAFEYLFFNLDLKYKESVTEFLAENAPNEWIEGFSQTVLAKYQDYPNEFCVLSRFAKIFDDQPSKIVKNKSEWLEKMIRSITNLYKGMDQKNQKASPKSIIHIFEKILFGDDAIFLYLEQASDKEMALRLFSELEKDKHLSAEKKIKIKALQEKLKT